METSNSLKRKNLDQLITDFSNQNLENFFFNKLTSFQPDADEFYNVLGEISNFENPKKIGEAELKDGDELLVFTCQFRGELTQRSAKKRQFEIAKKILKEDFKDGAIFVFYDEAGNFRFSFIRRYYGKDQKYSNWKRFTYYVQPGKQNKTFRRQLDSCDFSSLDAIESAFNVETLSKEFYTELSHWYFASLSEVEFPNEYKQDEHQLNSQSMIRLITRMMFVWFMKQKELIPDEIFDKNYLDGILKYNDKTGSTYYKAILQNLFFATLNTEMGEKRKWVTSTGYGVQHFYRYKRFFTEKGADDFLNLMQNIPFLNGGLFENLDIVETADADKGLPKKNIRIDCFSDNKSNEERLKVPDYLFFGTREADISALVDDKRKSNVKIEGLIDILNRFDFTIDENSPDDQEVALDPELLGTVFENLLASYNPETQSTARKESGSFYTPRPIVDYMVKESLFYYLEDKSKLEEEKLRLLLEGNETDQLSEEEKRELVEHLTHIKILDPACGSGAFPMGVLQQLVRILNLLDPENTIYKEKLQEKLKQELQLTIDKSNFEELKTNIEEVFANQYNDPDYARKLFLIQNCLYGVDIQSIAMQITKLRFFISLLVEQQIDENLENMGVKPLPNLETKFVAANTLIGLQKQDGILKNLFLQDLEEKLDKVREKYFNARSYKTKRKHRTEILEIRNEISQILISDGWPSETAKQIAEWDPFDQNASSSWFDPEWMFGVKSFDVVIGNPPYGAKLTDNEKQYFKRFFKNKSSETAILFVEKGMSFLNRKGCLVYIIPKAFTYASNYRFLRDFVEENLDCIVDCGVVFEKVKLEANIIGLKLNSKNKYYNSLKYDKKNGFHLKTTLNKDLKSFFGFYPNGLNLEEINLGRKISNLGMDLKKICINQRGQNLQRYIKDEGKYGIIGGKQISRYGIEEIRGYINDRSLLNEKSKISKHSILAQNIVAHILNPFPQIKIIACIPNKEAFILDTINQLTIINKDVSTKFLWAILNSSLINWYTYLFIYSKAIRTMHFDNPSSSRIPFPKNYFLMQKKTEKIVDKILSKKENNEDTTAKEREIDVMVYKLYELTYDEVLVVDPEFWLSGEEYEEFKV